MKCDECVNAGKNAKFKMQNAKCAVATLLAQLALCCYWNTDASFKLHPS